MVVAVVKIGHVRVSVHEGAVFVGVGVTAGQPVCMFMVVMTIVVDVLVFMYERVM